MKIEVQFFSRLRDVAGTAQLELEMPTGQTLGDLLTRLYSDYPKLRDWDSHLLTAVGLDYAAREQVLREGEVVSVMPPVQGG